MGDCYLRFKNCEGSGHASRYSVGSVPLWASFDVGAFYIFCFALPLKFDVNFGNVSKATSVVHAFQPIVLLAFVINRILF